MLVLLERASEPEGGKTLRRYDVVFIALSNLSDADISEVIERYQNMVTERKGLIIKVEKWGKRKLAYEINKQTMGFYVLFDFAGYSAIVDEVERNLKIDDKILKFLTVKTAEEITEAEVGQIIAAAAKVKEQEEVVAAEESSPQSVVSEAANPNKVPENPETVSETKEEA